MHSPVNPVAEKLAEARKLIERGWTQEANARDKSGREVAHTGRSAVCFCALGAIGAVCAVDEDNADSYFDAREYIQKAIGRKLVALWNDAPERTQAEVIAAFVKAEELARASAVEAAGGKRGGTK